MNSTGGSEHTKIRREDRAFLLERVLTPRLTVDHEVGLSLEVLGGEFDLASFIQLDVSHCQAVDLILGLQHHLPEGGEA